MNKYKNFVVTLSSYKCDKNCPYCIAKMNKLPSVEDDLEPLKITLQTLKNQGHAFKSCIISGNGEPSLYSFEHLQESRNILEQANIFALKRIQSSGNLFWEDEKFDLFKDWIIEVTRVARDFSTDSSILKYNRDYMTTDNFQRSNIRMNVVMLKNNIGHFVEDIYEYLKFQNIDQVAIKFLDKNSNTKQDRWIRENGVSYDEITNVINILDNNFEYIGHEFQNHIWKFQDKKITLYHNENYNTDKVQENFMWYGRNQLS